MTDLVPLPLEVVVPGTGELVRLDEPGEVARGLAAVREMKHLLDDVRATLEAALVEEARRQGTKTLHLGELEVTVYGGKELEWDFEVLEAGLRDAGLPPERLTALITHTVTRRVNQTVVRQLEGVNPDYAKAIAAARSYRTVAWRASVR